MPYMVAVTLSFGAALQAVDRDDDGMDDIWEWYYNAQDLLPGDDADGDGNSNLEESRATTDPFDASDLLKPSRFSVTALGIELEWTSRINSVYQVMHSPVKDGEYSGLSSAVVGDGSVYTLVLDADGQGSVFTQRGTPEEAEIATGVSLGEAVFDQNARFFCIDAIPLDSDNDELSDWAETVVGQAIGLDKMLAETSGGTADADALLAWIADKQNVIPEVTVVSSDRCAYENNAPLEGVDHGEITISRTGQLPISVELYDMGIAQTANTSVQCNGLCCQVVGIAGDEAAEAADYQLYDENDQLITGAISFAFGQAQRKITVKAVDDGIYEYPETINFAARASTDNSFTLGAANGASIQLLDAPDEAENEVVFVGAFSQDGRAVVPSDGSGYISAKLSGSRREMLISSSFSNLTSPQQDCHVHKSNSGPAPGAIIYAITEVPYDETTDPLNGPLDEYPWDLTESPGATSTDGVTASRQVIIDSLFGQSGETPLYLNIHTVDNPAGEIWAFLAPAAGSSEAPAPPAPSSEAGSSDFPLLSGTDLERDVRRFLDQATFGGTEADVAALVSQIETERLTDPTYHRVQAFEAWIDAQVTLDQTYMMDYLLADFWQTMVLAGFFDPARNPGYTKSNGDVVETPSIPANWPAVDRSNPDPEKWVMNQPFPMTGDELHNGARNGLYFPNTNERRSSTWMLALNAHDQLRQKLGYSIQQILVISSLVGEIADQQLSYANYIDQLNTRAFSNFRDLLGYANNSPIMGNWLSSLQNQKEADLDGDGEPDVFADENLARENMQLFSIGLFEQWEDGSLKLSSSGSPIPTYTNTDIKEFAKILTGQSFSKDLQWSSTPEDWGGATKTYDTLIDNTVFDRGLNQIGYRDTAYYYPMKMFPDYHDPSEVKTLVGGRQVDNFAGVDLEAATEAELQALAQKDLEDAMDWLAGKPGDGLPDYDGVNSHGSTPAFICHRLIQKFTTSNPSQTYLHRVAHTFKETEGDMLATVKAILLDPEVRIYDIGDTTFGIKKNPLEAYIQLHRNFEAINRIPLSEPDMAAYPYDHALGEYSNSANPDLYLSNFGYPSSQLDNHVRNHRFNQQKPTNLGINLHEQETVFNWYMPDFNPGGEIGGAGLVSPEMQLVNDTSVVLSINYMNTICRSYGLKDATKLKGHGGNNVGGRSSNQRIAFQLDNADVDKNDNTQLPIDLISEALYPDTAPTAIEGRSSESLADEALVDAIDRRLTYGALKEKYPYDPSDDDDPNTPEVDESLKNPRECIIDALTAHGDPYGSNASNNRRYKTADALWLITFTPEYIVRK